MTDAEFEKIQRECAEYVKATTLEPNHHEAEDAYQAHAEHAEPMRTWS